MDVMQRQVSVFVAMLIALAACAVNPVTGKREISLISESSEIEMGTQNYAPMQQSEGGEYDVDPALTEYVQRVGNKLAAVVGSAGEVRVYDFTAPAEERLSVYSAGPRDTVLVTHDLPAPPAYNTVETRRPALIPARSAGPGGRRCGGPDRPQGVERRVGTDAREPGQDDGLGRREPRAHVVAVRLEGEPRVHREDEVGAHAADLADERRAQREEVPLARVREVEPDLLRDADLRLRLSEQSKARHGLHFTLDRMVAETSAVYEGAIG